MYLANGRLVVSPSDLVGHLACEHLTSLSLRVASGALVRPAEDDPTVAVVQQRGNAHEAAYLATLRSAGRGIVEIADGDPAARAAATRRALAVGPDVVYQATFYDLDGEGPIWRGHADFLARTERASRLGAFSYQPEDTKLARHVRPSAVIQLCEYAEQLTKVQGIAPERIFVVLGGERRVALRLAEFAAYYRASKRAFEADLATRRASYPTPVEHCTVCVWRRACDEQRVADDHLSLVAGLSSDQARRLHDDGMRSVADLARSSGGVAGIGDAALARLRAQAVLQVASRTDAAAPPYELLPDATAGVGLGALPPPPDAGDLFFDIEGDPYVGDGGIEYLLGVAWREADGTFGYRAFWAHNEDEERASFEAFIDFVNARRAAHPGLHVYHYAPYEPSALGRLMGRYGTRETEVDALLRGGVLVDLYRVVRQALRAGTPSYSLKKIESLYRAPRTEAVTDAGSSIVEYERWLEAGEQQILEDLEEYNRIDCRSTLELRDWLEARRDDYAATHGVAAARPAFVDPAASATTTQQDSENAALREALRREPDRRRADASCEIGPDIEGGDDGRAARALLGELLDWYRREDRPEWWRFYQRIFVCDESDLFLDTEAIAGLEYLGEGEQVNLSVVRRYRFDPAQECKISVGSAPCDPASERAKRLDSKALPGPGTVHSLDVVRGEIGLLRGRSSRAPHPRSLIPSRPIGTEQQRQALRRVATSVIDDGIDGPARYRALRDLLLRQPPRTTAGRLAAPLVGPGEPSTDAAVRIARALAGGYLAVQGPPGSGKTSLAARIAVALVVDHKTVGVTANSHAVIANLVRAIVAEAARQGVTLFATQKTDGDERIDHPMLVQRAKNSDVVADLAAGANVVAGTGWLFSRPEFDQTLDCVMIDEAGQFSLADTVAVATAARNLVLVGDPCQLSQPSSGTHPPGVAVAALDHVLGGAETMPEGRGIFLEESHRLHPDICRFISEVVYAGRLHSDEACRHQSIGGSGALAGSGLRWLPVDHRGNRVSSAEEVAAVCGVVDDLLGRPFTDKRRATRPLEMGDILVVAPYNAQVAALRAELPHGVRVGTVDKFQGQQAAVVVTSLATSDLSEIPRGMEFLYSRNRLNVAVSRAQALSVLVASPLLLQVKCHTVEQMRLANGLCRFVELAAPQRADA